MPGPFAHRSHPFASNYAHANPLPHVETFNPASPPAEEWATWSPQALRDALRVSRGRGGYSQYLLHFIGRKSVPDERYPRVFAHRGGAYAMRRGLVEAVTKDGKRFLGSDDHNQRWMDMDIAFFKLEHIG